ncbi:MAG: aspartate/glutamate racemase family protein [Clostridia bacterium]|nr:aspartate/glutamate racemase family protein [Clostridia bacterium]
MKNGCVAVIDSGIGGLNLLNELVNSLPNYTFIYYGDNKNAPYGNRTKRDLLDKTFNVVCELINRGATCVVFACNTLSVSVMPELKKYFSNVKFFGVFPPVDIAEVKKEKNLLLCTPNTAKGYKPTPYLDIVTMPTLAKTIEDNKFNLERVDFTKIIKDCDIKSLTRNFGYQSLTTKRTVLTTKNQLNNFDHHLCPYNTIILGCTHYNFIKYQIFNHFQPQKIIGGETFTKKIITKYFQNKKSLEKTKGNTVLFLGESAKENENFYTFYFKNNYNFLQKNLKK